MAAEEDVAIVMDSCDGYTGLAKGMAAIAATRAPEGIEDDF